MTFFCNLIGRLEMKSRLWLDNVETPNRPHEAHARWTHWGTTKKVLFRPISEQQNSLSFNNIQLLHLNEIQYCCTLLHKTSYWSSSSVVIVLLHTALFYSNFEILWKLWNFLNFLKILSFWIFLKSYKIFESFEILWKFGILKKKLKFSNILLSKKPRKFCAIKNHIALSCHVISFIDFAWECNMIIYCTEIAFC